MEDALHSLHPLCQLAWASVNPADLRSQVYVFSPFTANISFSMNSQAAPCKTNLLGYSLFPRRTVNQGRQDSEVPRPWFFLGLQFEQSHGSVFLMRTKTGRRNQTE